MKLHQDTCRSYKYLDASCFSFIKIVVFDIIVVAELVVFVVVQIIVIVVVEFIIVIVKVIIEIIIIVEVVIVNHSYRLHPHRNLRNRRQYYHRNGPESEGQILRFL